MNAHTNDYIGANRDRYTEAYRAQQTAILPQVASWSTDSDIVGSFAENQTPANAEEVVRDEAEIQVDELYQQFLK